MNIAKRITVKKTSYYSGYQSDYGSGYYQGYTTNPSYTGVKRIAAKKKESKENATTGEGAKAADITAHEWGYVWSKKDSCWLLLSADFAVEDLEKDGVFHMGRQSVDYLHWNKVEPGKGYISSDGNLFKLFNKEAKEHVITTTETAVHLGWLRKVPGKVSTLIGTCTLDCFLDTTNEILGWRIWQIDSIETKGEKTPVKPNGKYITSNRTIEVSGVECALVCEKVGFVTKVVYFEVTDVSDLLDVVDSFVAKEKHKDRTDPTNALNCKNFEPVLVGKSKFLNCNYCKVGLQGNCKGAEPKIAEAGNDNVVHKPKEGCMHYMEGVCTLDATRTGVTKECQPGGCTDWEKPTEYHVTAATAAGITV